MKFGKTRPHGLGNFSTGARPILNHLDNTRSLTERFEHSSVADGEGEWLSRSDRRTDSGNVMEHVYDLR